MIKQVYGATKWVAGHGDEIDVDGKRLAIVGNSVGGNMATVTVLMAKARGGLALCAEVLFWPVTRCDTINRLVRVIGAQGGVGWGRDNQTGGEDPSVYAAVRARHRGA